MDRVGQIFDSRYRLERLLGQGGMAAVYLARDRKLDKTVAVKVLSERSAAVPKSAQRFVQEARAASRVRHPNVVDVTDFGVADDGAAYLVMELVRGEDLARTLDREGPLPWSRVAPIGLQICAALAAAHRVGVIHRDIKPANCIRLHRAGIPDFIKVVDFGIARVLDPRYRLVEPTAAGTVLGTPEYMAPEVAAGAEAGPAADLYAVGALLYKLLTGSPPFVGDSYRAVLSQQIFEPPVPPRRRAPGRDIPEAADALILRALAKEPEQRYPDMAALAAAIADTLPQRPAVELWFAPSASGTSLVDSLPPLPLVPDEAPTPTPELPLPSIPTRPRSEGGLARTIPLAVQASARRRVPPALTGLGLLLLGALMSAVLMRWMDGSEDMAKEGGLPGHVVRDMALQSGRDRGQSDVEAPTCEPGSLYREAAMGTDIAGLPATLGARGTLEARDGLAGAQSPARAGIESTQDAPNAAGSASFVAGPNVGTSERAASVSSAGTSIVAGANDGASERAASGNGSAAGPAGTSLVADANDGTNDEPSVSGGAAGSASDRPTNTHGSGAASPG